MRRIETEEAKGQEAKRVRLSREAEDDLAHQEEIFGPDEPENKRRRTQEERDWHDDFCSSEKRTISD
eukprot:4334543-Karenia_brevis.AAC.1